MQITKDIFLIGSGAAGFDLTDELDCHVYLIDGVDSWAIIDSGAGRNPRLIVQNIEDTMIDTNRPGFLFLTHGHADHSGGAAAIRSEYPHMRVFAGIPVAEWVSEGNLAGISLDRAQSGGTYPADYVFTSCPGIEGLSDGQMFELGGSRLEALNTPGHSDGHVCYLLVDDSGRKVLFSGDCVFTEGRISVQNTHDARIGPYADSIARLDRLSIDALMPGHHSLSVQRAARHVAIAQARFAQALLPISVP